MSDGWDLAVEDRLDIHDLVARFNRAADFGSADDVAELFTADGVFEGPGAAAHGGEAIRAYNRELESNPASSRSKGARHLTFNVVIDAQSADSARIQADLLMVVPGAVAPEISMLGKYEDEVVRTLDGWRFRQRRVIVAQIRRS